MADQFASQSKGLSSPADSHYVVVPADNTELPVKPRALYVLTSGNLTLRDEVDGSPITYPVTAGQTLPFRPYSVDATNTDATVVAWY